MGTRQELGLAALLLLLALPAIWAGVGSDGPAATPRVCARPVGLSGPLAGQGLLCLERHEAGQESLGPNWPEACRLPPAVEAGQRLWLEGGPAGGCLVRSEPMSGAHRLLVGLGIDPNRASAQDLQVLPGIGPTLAERIVADRRLHGPFEQPDDLERVKGIGPVTLARIRDLLRLDPPTVPQAVEAR